VGAVLGAQAHITDLVDHIHAAHARAPEMPEQHHPVQQVGIVRNGDTRLSPADGLGALHAEAPHGAKTPNRLALPHRAMGVTGILDE